MTLAAAVAAFPVHSHVVNFGALGVVVSHHPEYGPCLDSAEYRRDTGERVDFGGTWYADPNRLRAASAAEVAAGRALAPSV